MSNLSPTSENERATSAATSLGPPGSASQPILLSGNNQQTDAMGPETAPAPPNGSSSTWQAKVTASESLESLTNQSKPEASTKLDEPESRLSPSATPPQKQKNLILHSLVSLARRPSFLQGMLKMSSDATEKSPNSQISEAAPLQKQVSHPKVDSIKSNSWPLSSHDAPSKAASSSTGTSLTLDHLNQVQANNRALRAHFKQKILQFSEQLRVEQANREENQAEYLQLAAMADQHQAAQAWQVFERRNQRVSCIIGQLQRRLQNCQCRLQELEQSKHLGNLALKQEIPALLQSQQQQELTPEKILSRCPSSIMATDIQLQPSDSMANLPISSSWDTTISSMISIPEWVSFSGSTVMDELTEMKKFHSNLEEKQKNLKQRYLADHRLIQDSFQDEQYRHQQLEAQMNDLLELHQTETMNMKQDLACLEEKAVYQSVERARDILIRVGCGILKLPFLEMQACHPERYYFGNTCSNCHINKVS
ncbi:testis-specific protein TEX28 isoform X2 [Rhinatrema bivittatum]|uniref:testis-specific protein TEX28 isoform X2 n=1 Tax=Rhinatrema bivittatum TaxID=194408 RepID=UPI0011294222|nr:testis-specific protein TEX28 isoform X2 [Rhinatrema bivittatum]